MAFIKKVIIVLIVLAVLLYFGIQAYTIVSISKNGYEPVPIEIVKIGKSIPENPYDYGDCIADLPWGVETVDPDLTLRMNKEKGIAFNYGSIESMYAMMLEYDEYKPFFEKNNIHSNEDLTCYLYSFNSKDISWKYLFKPAKELAQATYITLLQNISQDQVEKVYDVRNDDLRAIVAVRKVGEGTSYGISMTSPIHKNTLKFTIMVNGNSLTEEDIFNFISTISFKEE